ncbi:MAG: hypothetical protein ACOX6V_04490 [Patescibacteria group bacterium]|jgi:tetratricopeptide (TPR) repeat protein
MEINELAVKAAVEKKAGNLDQALVLYSQAMDQIVRAAMKYALKYEDVLEKIGNTETIREAYLIRVKEFYRKDETACRISNNMGVIFVEMGNYAAAKDMFIQAIDLTPEDVDYADPVESLEAVESLF